MNWTKISAITEIVSSVAILATLGYLAIQTQQNTAALVSASRQQSLNSELELLRMRLDYPETANGYADDALFHRRGITTAALFRIREHQWFQLQDGQLDKASFRSYLQLLVNSLRNDQDAKILWDQFVAEGTLNSEFADTVADALN